MSPLIPRVFIIMLLANSVSKKPASVNRLRGESRGAHSHSMLESNEVGREQEFQLAVRAYMGPLASPHCPSVSCPVG